MTQHGTINWESYLDKSKGETMQTVSMACLRRRRNLRLGGDKTSRADKVRMNKLEVEAREKDPALFELLGKLRKEAKGDLTKEVLGWSGTGPGREAYYTLMEFIDVGGEQILRSLNYKKIPRKEYGTEDDLPFEQQRYMTFDLDYVLDHFIALARSLRLGQSFIDFEIKVLQAAIESGLPINLKAANEELEARKAGIDRYVAPIVHHLDATPPPSNLNVGIITTLNAAPGIDYRERPPSLAQQTIAYFKKTGEWKRNEDVTNDWDGEETST